MFDRLLASGALVALLIFENAIVPSVAYGQNAAAPAAAAPTIDLSGSDDSNMSQEGLFTPILRVANRGNAAIAFSIRDSDREVCFSTRIRPAHVIMILFCGDEIRWHDGLDYQTMDIKKFHTYEIRWSRDNAWEINDITDQISR